MRALALAMTLMLLAASATLAITATAAPAQATDDGKQEGRRQFIEKMQRKGIIAHVDVPNIRPHVYVTWTFHVMMNFKEKQSMMDALLSYYYLKDQEANTLIIKDALTGKRIGYLDSTGLHMNYPDR